MQLTHAYKGSEKAMMYEIRKVMRSAIISSSQDVQPHMYSFSQKLNRGKCLYKS